MNKLLLWYLAVCQLLDGILTYIGVHHFGTHQAEGNPIIRFLIRTLDAFFALLLVKSIALFIIFVLGMHIGRAKSPRVTKILFLISCFYTFAVVLWLYVLGRDCGIYICLR